MTRVALIYTGGTIGCVGRPLCPLSPDRFSARWRADMAPLLPRGITVTTREFHPALDSSRLQPADWCRLARAVLDAAPEADAVLVLHGTDTMASSAAALAYLTTLLDAEGALLGRLACPVILTGAQVPLFDDDAGLRAGTDATRNVLDAVELARDGQLSSGVHLVFGGERMPGPRSLKVSTLDTRAFACPNGEGSRPLLPSATTEELTAQLDRIGPLLGRRAVLTFPASPNAPDALAAALAGGVDRLGDRLGALLLLGYGIGNLPAEAELSPIIAAVRDRGAPVVVASQVPAGPVLPATYGAGNWLGELGVIASGDMTVPAMQAKLHVGLALAEAEGWPLARLEAFLRRPVAGEIGS